VIIVDYLKSKNILLMFLTVCVVSVFYYLTTDYSGEKNYSLLGKKAPNFRLPILGVERLFIFDVSNKISPTVITLWSPECFECISYLGYIKILKEQYKEINFVGLTYNSRKEDVEKWIGNHGNPFNYLLDDKQGDVMILYKFLGFPESILVDSNGKIVKWDITRPVPSLVDYLKDNADSL